MGSPARLSGTDEKPNAGGVWRSLFSKSSVSAPAQSSPNLPPWQDDERSVQALSRCENAAARFSKVLFAIAQKPSKVSFESVDPKTGKRMVGDLDALDKDAGSSNPPETAEADRSATGKKQMDKQAIHDEILRRWSTSRRERSAMEELGVIQTEEGIQQKKQEIIRQQQQGAQQRTVPTSATEQSESSSGSGGTVPRW